MKKSELKQMIREELLREASDSKAGLQKTIGNLLAKEVSFQVISKNEMKEILKAVEKILA